MKNVIFHLSAWHHWPKETDFLFSSRSSQADRLETTLGGRNLLHVYIQRLNTKYFSLMTSIFDTWEMGYFF